MREFINTAFYYKNVPMIERLLRVGAGAFLAAIPIVLGLAVWIVALAIANGLFIAATGFFGFCPACYMLGRRTTPRSANT